MIVFFLFSANIEDNFAKGSYTSSVNKVYTRFRNIFKREADYVHKRNESVQDRLDPLKVNTIKVLTGVVKGATAAAVLYSGASLPTTAFIACSLFPSNTFYRFFSRLSNGMSTEKTFDINLVATLAFKTLALSQERLPTSWMQIGAVESVERSLRWLNGGKLPNCYKEKAIGDWLWTFSGAAGDIWYDTKLLKQAFGNEQGECIVDIFNGPINDAHNTGSNALVSLFASASMLSSKNTMPLVIFPLLITPVKAAIPQRTSVALNTISILPGNVISKSLAGVFSDADNDLLQLSATLTNGSTLPSCLNMTLKPRRINSYPSDCRGLAILGAYAYLARGVNGIRILAISNNNLAFVKDFVPPSDTWAYDVDILDSKLYIVSPLGLRIFNISDPLNPNELGMYRTNFHPTAAVKGIDYSPFGVALSGTTAFITTSGLNPEFLQIINIVNPSNPICLKNYTLSFEPQQPSISGSTLTVCSPDGSAVFFNITNAMNPTIFKIPANNHLGGDTTIISGNILISAAYVGGVKFFDITNIDAPKLLGSYTTAPSAALDVKLIGDTLYVCDNFDVIDVSQWEISGTPALSDIGNYNIKLIATDPSGGSVSDTFTIRVEGAPKVNNSIPWQYAKVGKVYNYLIPKDAFSDPNQDSLSYTAKDYPSWLTFNPSTSSFAGIPKLSDIAISAITVTANDSITGTASTTFNLQVQPDDSPVPNPAPVPVTTPQSAPIPQTIPSQIVQNSVPITAPMQQAANNFVEGKHFAFAITPLEEGDNISLYTILLDDLPLPPWMSFNGNIVSANPPLDSKGKYTLRVQNKNGKIKLMPIKIEQNYPPELVKPIPGIPTATVGDYYQYNLDVNGVFVDKNNDTLTYSVQGMPKWLAFKPTKDPLIFELSGKPGINDINFYNDQVIKLSLIAEDDLGLKASAPFELKLTGETAGKLIIKIVSPVVSAAGVGFTIYKNRAVIINAWNKYWKKYQKAPVDIIINKPFAPKKLDTALENADVVQALIKTTSPKCYEVWKSEYKPLPGGLRLPTWLHYDVRTNELTTQNNGPDERDVGSLLIQVRQNNGVIQEEFPLYIKLQKVSDVTRLNNPLYVRTVVPEELEST